MSKTIIDVNDDTDKLVDISTVNINKNLPKHERIAEYIRQIKNPYRFKCGKFIVTNKFSNNGVTLEDCLRNIMT